VNKSELVDAVHSAAGGVDKKDVASVVDSLIEVVQGAVARGDKVTVPGFGAWSRTQRAARTGRNPRTGKEITIPPARVPRFKPSRSLKTTIR
jgi:DNA-binding protein HU-beta